MIVPQRKDGMKVMYTLDAKKSTDSFGKRRRKREDPPSNYGNNGKSQNRSIK